MKIFPEIKGEIEDYDVLVHGHLKWNRYFGESAESPPRGDPSTCSSVLIRGRDFDGRPYRLILDPTIRLSAEAYYFDLNRRTGLGPEAITHCFSTHHHFDHWHGLNYFPGTPWLTGAGNAALIAEASGMEKGRFTEVCGEFLPGIYALPLPGHTERLHGLAFRFRGKRVLAAGDAVMTKHHLDDRRTEFQPDEALQRRAAETLENIAQSFDLVIPGHDNTLFLG
ncbi:MAG: MBL fold metallo-hydrolase [Christensenellaceae bacterium]|jgi:glyoxylase-like metal-dependent hydrolase (beta-lactamase superfamily II)|nr:MBL fold metallo-hydrolase [Christensenellaceae bacterium]